MARTRGQSSLDSSCPRRWWRSAAIVLALVASFLIALRVQVHAAGTSPVIADSVADFSGVQGQHGWYYGYYTSPFSSDTFHTMTQFVGGTWYEQASTYWTELWATGGHPNSPETSGGRQPVEQWAVRRWISTVSATVHLSGQLAKAQVGGDGVAGHILVDGKEVWTYHVDGGDTVGQAYNLDVPVHIGSTVDTAIAPGPSDYVDSSELTTTITATASVTSGGGSTPPNSPQNVANSQGQSAQQIYVTWQAPVPNGVQFDHYNIVEVHADGTPGVIVDTVSASTLSDTISSTASLAINPCEYYRFGVVAVGTNSSQSTIAYPLTPVYAQGLPASSPKVVVVLLQGVGSHIGGGAFDPLTTSSCTSSDGLIPVSGDPAPLQDMVDQWNNINVTDHGRVQGDHGPGPGAGNQMIDTLASQGAVVLPFSYTDAKLSRSGGSPTFKFTGYDAGNVGNTYPDAAAHTLDTEIRSIHKVWHSAHIVVVGHSNGGLIAELWWILDGQHHARGVVHAFSLDSPLNGVANSSCTVPGIGALCGLGHVGPALADTYSQLWDGQTILDPKIEALAQRRPIFTAVGTTGDPLYDGGNGVNSHNVTLGLVSQVYFSEPSCHDSGWDLESRDCTVVGPSFLDPCGPLDDGHFPYGLATGGLWRYGVVKNCPGVVGKIMTYVMPHT